MENASAGFSISVSGHKYTYDASFLKKTLRALGNLENKQVSWVRADLTLENSSQAGCSLFCLINLIARYVSRDVAVFLREYFFQVNLETSQAILNELKDSISGDSELEQLFKQATKQFNTIAFNHQIETPDFKGKGSEQPKSNPFEGFKLAQKDQIENLTPIPSESKDPNPRTVCDLFKRLTSCWSEDKKDYINTPFYPDSFYNDLIEFNEKFPLTTDPEKHYGFIEKKDLKSTDKVYVRADLHGDLKSLLENLRTLQQEGYLDDQFRCKQGMHLVFLGDYVDRGSHSCHVLEVLAALKMENPNQVFLIYGGPKCQDQKLQKLSL